jgi:hypothetical protein
LEVTKISQTGSYGTFGNDRIFEVTAFRSITSKISEISVFGRLTTAEVA